jgi:hypothetical protein
MGIQINGQTDNISATDGSLTVSGADLGSASASSLNISGIVTASGGFSGNLTGTASTATAAATAYGLSGSPTLSIGAGTASAPSISPSGDPNTGVFFPSADTVAIAEGGVEALRVDSSGRLLVGTSTSVDNGRPGRIQVASTSDAWITATRYSTTSGGGEIVLGHSRGTTVGTQGVVSSGDVLGGIYFTGSDGSAFQYSAFIKAEADAGWSSGDAPGRLVFSTTADGASSPTERMRIHADGGISTNSLTTGPGSSTFGTFLGRAGSPGFVESYRNADAATAAAAFGGNAGSAVIRGDGDLENTNNRYTGFSDIKLKQNIEDASSQWDDIKAIQVRKYELIANPDRKHIGVVAQELEQVCPGLVIDRIQNEETGETVKSVAYSVLYMKAVKALQEAMERIEQLEASNADLLARVSALESA